MGLIREGTTDRRVAFGGMGLIRGETTLMCNCNLSNFR